MLIFLPLNNPFTCFNSTLVQLKGGIGKSEIAFIKCFNSTLVQLKDWGCTGICGMSICFNSTLVQLKGKVTPLKRYRTEACFNSTLVQLKAVKNANKYTSKSMIYHPFILIFYKHLQSTFNS